MVVTFYEKELQERNQKELRTEKVIEKELQKTNQK